MTLNSQLQLVAPQTNSNLPRKGTEERVARQISVSERTLQIKKISQKKRVKKLGVQSTFYKLERGEILKCKNMHACLN